jgi:hypothetical protein
LLLLSVLLVSQPAQAGVFDVPPKNYYGPLQRLHGVGFTNDVTKDGYLKIHAQGRRMDGDGFAVDSALYRAAEMARVGGYRYVEMHDAYSQRNRVGETATVFALPTNTAAHPARCRSGRPKRCYTADVLSVLKTLSGPSGTQPGVAVANHVDQYGRSVTYSGFGIGSISN